MALSHVVGWHTGHLIKKDILCLWDFLTFQAINKCKNLSILDYAIPAVSLYPNVSFSNKQCSLSHPSVSEVHASVFEDRRK